MSIDYNQTLTVNGAEVLTKGTHNKNSDAHPQYPNIYGIMSSKRYNAVTDGGKYTKLMSLTKTTSDKITGSFLIWSGDGSSSIYRKALVHLKINTNNTFEFYLESSNYNTDYLKLVVTDNATTMTFDLYGTLSNTFDRYYITPLTLVESLEGLVTYPESNDYVTLPSGVGITSYNARYFPLGLEYLSELPSGATTILGRVFRFENDTDDTTDKLYVGVKDAFNNTVLRELPHNDRIVPISRDVLPTADITQRGKIHRIEGASGYSDKLYICIKRNDDVYKWMELPEMLVGSTTWTPGGISDKSQVTQSITVGGATVGDHVSASIEVSQQGMMLTGYVSAPNTVTVVLYNNTGSTITLGNTVLHVKVTKV